MKPRARWLTRFASWFFNTSPEWVAREPGESTAAEPQQRERQMQQMQQPPPAPGDTSAGDVPDPKQRPH